MIIINNTPKSHKKFGDWDVVEIKKEDILPEEKELIENELYKIFKKYCQD